MPGYAMLFQVMSGDSRLFQVLSG